MIEFTAQMIKYILQYTSPTDILSEKVEYDNISLDYLMRICFAAEDHISEMALEQKLYCFKEWVISVMKDKMLIVDRNECVENPSGVSLFGMISSFSSKVLKFSEEELVYRYKYLEIWHDISAYVGADLFMADRYVLADMRQYRPSVVRKVFEWKLYPDHDNYGVNTILKKGISDNHFHLNGSLPYFELSWIFLMNAVRQPKLIELLERMQHSSRNIRKQYVTEQAEESYGILYLKAVLIRIYLYSVLNGSNIQLGEYETSVEWAFQGILEKEQPIKCLNEIGNGNQASCKEIAEGLLCENVKASVSEWIQIFYGINHCNFTDLSKRCPYFYRFFWIEYTDIPLDKMPVKDVIFCRENMEAITDYVETHYGKVKLSEYRELYGAESDDRFQREWCRCTEDTVFRLLQKEDLLIASRRYIEGALVGIQNTSSARYKDYMLSEIAPSRAESNSLYDMMGERYFLYAMFYLRHNTSASGTLGVKVQKHNILHCQKIFSRRKCLKLFFMYLVIKDRFRRELIYNNERIGFRNFQQFNRRNTWFTTSFTQAELARISIRGAFEAAELNSLEVRVMPAETAQQNIDAIRRFDREICRENQLDVRMKNAVLDVKRVSDDPFDKDKYYYVFHFGKRKDDFRFNRRYPKCRHEEYRKKLRRYAEAIMIMREGKREESRRVLGIDACSSEDGCRPEVFAQVFRVLKNHIVNQQYWEEKMPQLRCSYHVGEENQDILDGLRAIDEAVRFLNLESGDRIGHATMLGIEPNSWYRQRKYRITIRQLDYLDNVAWLHQQIVDCHVPNENNLLEYLEKQFYTYFESVYREAIIHEYPSMNSRDFDICNYYTAWELRGDDPGFYKTGVYDNLPRREYRSIWTDYAINETLESELAGGENKRYLEKVAALYSAYHYSYYVRVNGEKLITVEIPHHMIKGIRLVQNAMMRHISRKGIFIETNPSSNVLITGMDGYLNHPITRFYNKELNGKRNLKEDECCQLNVSINTDDMGVFRTSLHSEYSLMAKALECMEEQDGEAVYRKDKVYDWLDAVRRMGNEQRFNKK